MTVLLLFSSTIIESCEEKKANSLNSQHTLHKCEVRTESQV